MNSPSELLRQGVASLLPGFDPASGTLSDPVFGCPTQYSTPYFAWCCAVLAAFTAGPERAAYAGRARRALRASLDYLLAPEQPPFPSDFQRDTGASSGRNHRDFFWPPVLKTWRLLADSASHPDLGDSALHSDFGDLAELDRPLSPKTNGYAQFIEAIARVDPLAAFAQRPPSNWAAVWLSGEWLRFRAGLSPFSLDQIDDWLGEFFRSHILLDRGFYQEPGHPNSYDLFTRLHLADILANGYTGRWLPQMETLLLTGLRRSLAVQLSDGALASAHRSTGQSWTDGAQIAFFTLAANHFATIRPELAAAAKTAAARAFASLARWQRPAGPFSPVHNCLPPELRVGYELYTADGHYSTLALAFLASAIQNGFDPTSLAPGPGRPAQTFIENDPIWRAVLHSGEISLQVNAFPAPDYDGFGLTDLTFGPGRYLQFASSVRYLETGQFFNPGLALRSGPGLTALEPPFGNEPALAEPLRPGADPASLRLVARPKGSFFPYTLSARLVPDGAALREATPGFSGWRTLLVPFLRDPGAGQATRWQTAPGRLELTLGEEIVAVEWEGPAERVVVLAQGFENRRGLCALARIDLAEPGEETAYRIVRVR